MNNNTDHAALYSPLALLLGESLRPAVPPVLLTDHTPGYVCEFDPWPAHSIPQGVTLFRTEFAPFGMAFDVFATWDTDGDDITDPAVVLYLTGDTYAELYTPTSADVRDLADRAAALAAWLDDCAAVADYLRALLPDMPWSHAPARAERPARWATREAVAD